jgi:hypothetical protein
VALLVGPLCCVGVANGVADRLDSSPLALCAVILANVIAQPVWLLFGLVGWRKLALGLTGRVAYAWRAIPEEELHGLPAGERRTWRHFCIAQGLLALLLSASMSLACGWPLLVWAVSG